MLIQLIRNAGQMTPQQMILSALLMFFALALSFSVHEFMHAFVANKLGDDIPRLQGRVTLNPIAHLDPMGTLLILIVGFGWGKPVMYNPNNLYKLKSKRLMNIMVHLAGVTGNFVLALLSMIIVTIVMMLTGTKTMLPAVDVAYYLVAGINGVGAPLPAVAIVYVFYYVYTFSIMLMAFNLIPILLPYRVRYSDGFMKFEKFAPMVLLALILMGSFTNVDVLQLIVNIIAFPAEFVISLICGFIGYLGYL